MQPYLELTKPRLTLLALAMVGLGFYMASWGSLDFLLLIQTLTGAALVGGGANALNQYLERDIDAKMKRTQNRPLPTGRLRPSQALAFGSLASVAGVLLLVLWLNPVTALLGGFTLFTYLACYTPLKRKSSLCTLVGAIPGAMPPLIGWTAVRQELTLEAWVLFFILYLWQLPHFLAIAWFCREDYARAGLPILTVLDPSGQWTARQVILYCLALLPVSLIPGILRMSGPIYFLTALTLGLLFLGFGLRMRLNPSVHAKKFFLSSIVYLLGLIVVMIGDKI